MRSNSARGRPSCARARSKSPRAPLEVARAASHEAAIADRSDAHLRALDRIEPGSHDVYNLGTGTGYSVRLVSDTARAVTGCDIAVQEEARRPSDPPRLGAAKGQAHREVRGNRGARPGDGRRRLVWHQGHPHGYSEEPSERIHGVGDDGVGPGPCARRDCRSRASTLSPGSGKS